MQQGARARFQRQKWCAVDASKKQPTYDLRRRALPSHQTRECLCRLHAFQQHRTGTFAIARPGEDALGSLHRHTTAGMQQSQSVTSVDTCSKRVRAQSLGSPALLAVGWTCDVQGRRHGARDGRNLRTGNGCFCSTFDPCLRLCTWASRLVQQSTGREVAKSGCFFQSLT